MRKDIAIKFGGGLGIWKILKYIKRQRKKLRKWKVMQSPNHMMMYRRNWEQEKEKDISSLQKFLKEKVGLRSCQIYKSNQKDLIKDSDINEEVPWCLLFVYSIVLVDESRDGEM